MTIIVFTAKCYYYTMTFGKYSFNTWTNQNAQSSPEVANQEEKYYFQLKFQFQSFSFNDLVNVPQKLSWMI